ncbi:hypothetical protein LOTGIDRAFT_158072 [Lottia gigantea]|uniref:DNA-directed DNA polymerase n=1 Tax=Lottia gigantea TaxID=225164 RepID=V4CDE3_LOTGI|nr:hypothetical protein LOTGIDRAFT_158072 [Lottia gigantea]ESO99914.1 hypothetical protein LOTGIDRAFT_158072 [Lottia gigantea]
MRYSLGIAKRIQKKNSRRAIPYARTLINLEKLRKKIETIKNIFPNINPTDNVPEEFYDKLMNVVELFVDTDCIDQMLKYLGQYDRKRLILISHNGSGFDNWIVLTNAKKLTHCPLKTPRGILSFSLSNPYTDEDLQKKWKRQKEIKGNYLQHINFTCSYQHESSSLAAWGNSSNLPANLRKIADVDIAKYTQDNWEELRHEWEPYAKRDTLCLGACLIKYNQVTKEVVNQNMSNNLMAPSLSLKGWYYLYHYDKEMVEEEWYETTRMVAKHTEKENIEKVYSHTNPFIRNFIRRFIKGGRVSANRKSFETNKMDDICNVLKEYISQTESNNIIDLFKEYSASTKDKTEVHSRLKKIECTKLMAFDANGLYASAMSDLDSEYPRAESGRPFLPEEEKEFVKLFNKQKFRPRTAILTVWFDYPKNMFFQPIPAKDKITFTNKEGKKETGNKIRFRKGFCHDVLTSVDIQEIVKAGGRIIRILDGIVYEENFKTPPYRDYILILRDLRNKYKREGNIVGSNCMKLLGNSLYGKSIQKDIFTTRHLWNEATLQANFDSRVKTYEKINDTQYIVETEIEEKEITTEDSKSTRLTPSHLGSFVLSVKKIMNNFIHVINGFYKPEIYYTDTDSLYISSKNWKKLNRAGSVSEKDYCKGKNDYGDGGIIFGLYLAPKVKYNIVLTSDGVLKEKKTFKGYSNDKISVEDYVQLASGHDVSNEFNKPLEKSFTNGVVIPNDKQTKVFSERNSESRDLRNKYKREGNIVGSNCMKLLGNSLYGKSIQKDIFTTRHLWNEATLQANFDSHIKTYDKINDTQYIVETEIEVKEITTEDSKSTRLTPSQLGSFVLSVKKIMNNFIHVISGFYKPEIYYTDTDSLYISSKNWKKLNRAGLVSEKDYCKGKNDYGDGGIIFGLYLAPKVKYNIVLTSDGVLKEKKTFKGYSNDKISVEDYVQLASGHDVSNEFNKPWEKSFTNGVVIPNDKQTKVFRSYLNNVKRKPPNSEGIMYPYNDKDEYSFDENYEFDDFDYLTIQEENEYCFK